MNAIIPVCRERIALPAARTPITIRAATMDDIPFIDSLQKQNSKQLGFFRRKQLEGYIAMGAVVVAEAAERRETRDEGEAESASLVSHFSSLIPVGYCISRDRYFKRDELGIIFQLCVVKGDQRKLVGASLIKHVFESSSYGCKLYCCRCAQDLEANHFWESLGFVPIAFRAGSRGKRRVHIFWEKRTREGDVSTQYWYPSETGGGAIGEDRLVFPIPPGRHWSEEMPVILPVPSNVEGPSEGAVGPAYSRDNPKLECRNPKEIETQKPKAKNASRLRVTPAGKIAVVTASGIRYVDRPGYVPEPTMTPGNSETALAIRSPDAPELSAPVGEKPKRVKKPRAKNDPRVRAMTRELRDRWVEMVSDEPELLASSGKYEISRALPDRAEPAPMGLPRPVGKKRLLGSSVAA